MYSTFCKICISKTHLIGFLVLFLIGNNLIAQSTINSPGSFGVSLTDGISSTGAILSDWGHSMGNPSPDFFQEFTLDEPKYVRITGSISGNARLNLFTDSQTSISGCQ